MIPPEIDGRLRDLRDYLSHDDAGFPSTDVCEKDKANLMRLACWFHHLNMITSCSRGMAQSLRREDDVVGGLLHYLMAPGVSYLTSTKVVNWVLLENQEDTERQLAEAKDNLNKAEHWLPLIKEEVKVAEKQLKKLNKHSNTHPQEKLKTQRKCDRLNA